MARTPKSNSGAAEQARTSTRRAPGSTAEQYQPDKKSDRRPNGTFAAGNTVPSPAGPGAPKKRFDARHYLRRALEMDPADMAPVPMCAADRIARRIAKTLTGDDVKVNVDGVPEEQVLYGKSLVEATSTALTSAYGSLVVTESGDHLAGAAARNAVDSLLEQAAELRRRSKGL